ncbi:MAG TPA: nitrilase-related carbon-nitrogen hydrolase [Rhizomicrobium sp.]|nr:nitrilase-related carbon-nitrogen hydrolase [Rhizomicrobium sp.]
MTAIACALLSAIGFYFSIGLGEQWWLAWLAPVPVLWFAFGETKGWQAFFTAWLGCALGSTSVLRAYAGVMPVFVLALLLLGPSAAFAASVMGARRVHRAFGAAPAMLAFAALWAGFDFLTAFSRAGGSVTTPAAAEVGAPMLIQTASLVGFTGVTFLMGFVAAGIALALRTRAALPAVLAVAVFAANAGFGAMRMSAPPDGHIRVGLIDTETRTSAINRDDEKGTLATVDAYAAEMAKLKDARLIVWPENIARVAPAWHDATTQRLVAAADKANATVVAGFNDVSSGTRHNVAYIAAAGAPAASAYVKRRLVLGLETPRYTPGDGGPFVLPNGTGVEICKDMDFQQMVRDDEIATHPRLLAVPAWDFGKDDWSHARVAVLRGVENGVPIARTAREGLLMLADRYGRVLAMRKTGGDFVSLTGELPLDGRGGNTVYDRIGDAFGWLCVAFAIGLVATAVLRLSRALSP